MILTGKICTKDDISTPKFTLFLVCLRKSTALLCNKPELPGSGTRTFVSSARWVLTSWSSELLSSVELSEPALSSCWRTARITNRHYNLSMRCNSQLHKSAQRIYSNKIFQNYFVVTVSTTFLLTEERTLL